MSNRDRQELNERVRKSRNREVFSEFIRLGQSDLYDWEPVRRALLREIAFLQVNDEKTKVPQKSPFRGDYVGWCYASQKYLAMRVGTSEDYVQHSVAVFEEDGVIEAREWTDDNGYDHAEYHVKEDVVTARQRPEGAMKEERKRPRRGGNKSANAGSFRPGNTAASLPTPQPCPPDSAAVAARHGSRLPSDPAAVGDPTCQPCETAVESGKDVLHSGLAPVASLPTHQQVSLQQGEATGRAKASGAARPRDGRESGSSPTHAEEKPQNQRAVGTVKKGLVKPPPNRVCYPEAFKVWKPGMRLPRCNRCDANLYPDENHVCPGYKPKLPIADTDAHYERMEQQRENMREQMDGHLDEMRAERMREAWEQEDAADADDGPPDHLTEDEYLEKLEADAAL